MNDLLALLFGAAIVVFFSYDRFNRTTDETGQQLQRLVNLLSPDKLRSGRVVFNAYTFYALTFLVIYFFLCAYAELIPALGAPDFTIGASKLPPLSGEENTPTPAGPLLGQTGGDVMNAILHQASTRPSASTSSNQSIEIGIDSSTSMAVALMIVGLGPAFPILQRFEAWMRSAAHRLAGIPMRVLSIRDELRTETINLNLGSDGAIPADTLLVPRSDWARLSYYKSHAKGQREVTEDFHNDLALVFAVSAWVIDHKLKLSNPHARERLSHLEEELKNRKNLLVAALDEKTEFSTRGQSREKHGDAASSPTISGIELGTSSPESWDRLVSDVDNLADDVCLLLAIYIEHDIIVSSTSLIQARSAQGSIPIQRKLAREKLELFLKDHLSDQGASRLRSYTAVTGLWVFSIVSVVAILWGLFIGPLELRLQLGQASDAYWRIMVYLSTSLTAFCIPMFTALAIRDGSIQLRRWRNFLFSDWTIVVPQAAFVLLVSWAVATILVLGVALWQAGVTLGWDASAERFWSTLRFAFSYNAPTALRGAILALIVILILDARRVSKWLPWLRKSIRVSFILALGAAIFMAVIGGGTRYLSSLAGTLEASVPRHGIDHIDRGLIAYAAIYTALLAFCVVFSVAEVVRNQRLRPSLTKPEAKAG